VKNFITYSGKRDRRETDILEAALEVFAELGFRKASIEDIAEKLDLSASALYRYFKDKRELYSRAVARGFGLWQEAVASAVERESDPVTRFRTACRSAFGYLAGEPRLRRILIRDPSIFPFFEAEDPFADINRGSVDLIEGLIREGVSAGVFAAPKGEADIRAVSRVIFSLYVLFVQKAYVAGEEEAALFERGLDLILDGLRAR
jgi:AcrR family transcriptional regulator